jgi:SAM-dependent methyltransferase
MDVATRTLWRPVGPDELRLIEATGRFPPRLADQPIFYPVCNERYAREIADRWNLPASGAGFVTRFRVRAEALAPYPVQTVGRAYHQELWVPAEALDAFNDAIVGAIEVVPPIPDHGVRDAYATVAETYAARLLDELAHKPFDRALLDVVAERTRDVGRVLDLGCGPGQVARYLHARGVSVEGVDRSPDMLAVARRENPELRFTEADFTALPIADGACAGVVGYYAIVHLPGDALPRACDELRRVLPVGGVALLAFHVGDARVHLDAWWELPVSVDFFFHPVERVEAALRAAGFRVDARLERRPDAAVEHPSERAYVFATAV